MMNHSEVQNPDIEPNYGGVVELRKDAFKYRLVREAAYGDSDPLIAQALRIQADGYTNDKEFVEPHAVEEDGALPDDIDEARGKNVDYIIGIPKDSKKDFADSGLEQGVSVRKMHIPEGGSLKDLPFYKKSYESLYPDYSEYLDSVDPSKIKEIAALSKLPGTSNKGVFEILRAVHQDALGKGEVWVFSIVSTTFNVFKHEFGDTAIQQIGDKVKFQDERIKENVELVPAILHPDVFIDELRRAALAECETGNTQQAHRIMRSFAFFTDGLSNDQLSEESYSLKSDII